MSTETPKPAPAMPEHHFPQMAPYPPPQAFNTGAYPPPGAYPQYFSYPPPSDGSHGDSNAPGGGPPPPQFMMSYPPHGMVYAFSHPPGQAFTSFPQVPTQSTIKPKRKQVKMACTNCASACKRCDDHRPCERCIKYGLTDSCVDGQRKERKKGMKRGPYKRKNKANSVEPYGAYPPQPVEGEWPQPGTTPQPPTAAPTTNAVAPFSSEGYPYYYPPPGFMPTMHDGQTNPDGAPNTNGQPPPIIPYYLHPGSFPPFPYFPHPGAYPPQSGPPPPPQTLDPSHSVRKPEEHTTSNGVPPTVADGHASPEKKKTKMAKSGDMKARKAKSAAQRSQKGSKDENENGEGNEHDSAEDPNGV